MELRVKIMQKIKGEKKNDRMKCVGKNKAKHENCCDSEKEESNKKTDQERKKKI